MNKVDIYDRNNNSANLKLQFSTSFPNFNEKHIDYVLSYSSINLRKVKEEKLDEKEFEKQIILDVFFDRLREKGVEIYCLKESENEDDNTIKYNALIHCSIDRLMSEYERIQLDARLHPAYYEEFLKNEPEAGIFDGLKKFSEVMKLEKQTVYNYLSTKFEKSIKFIFQGFDDDSLQQSPEGPFTNTERSLLAESILRNLKLTSKKEDLKEIFNKKLSEMEKLPAMDNEKIDKHIAELEERLLTLNGLTFMLHENFIDDYFILHDETRNEIFVQQMVDQLSPPLDNPNIESSDFQFVEESLKSVINSDKLDKDIRNKLHLQWGRFRRICKIQPINLIRDYFGESIAFYFAWMGFFIYTLIIPSIIGVVFFIVGLSQSVPKFNLATVDNLNQSALQSASIYGNYYLNIFADSFDNVLTPYFAFLICIWGALFGDLWRRETARLSFEWDTVNYENQEAELPEYVSKIRIRRKELEGKSKFIRYLWTYESSVKKLLSWTLIIFLMGIICLETAAIILLRIYLKIKVFANDELLKSVIGDFGSVIINLIVIIVMYALYKQLAINLTTWENHRTATEFNDALIYKLFAFEFFNNYGSLFYIAFFRNIEYSNGLFNMGPEYMDKCTDNNCMALLTIQVMLSFLIKPIPNFFLTIVLPFIKNNFKKYRATKGIERNMYYKYQNQNEFNENLVSIQVALAKSKERTDETIMNEYTEKIILYGYILLFACSFYLGPLILVIIVALDLRIDAKRLLWLYRRPVGFKAQDIGSWEGIIRFLNIVGIISNGFIIGFTSNWAISNLGKLENRLIFVLIYENLIFAIWLLILIILPKVPKSIDYKMRLENKVTRDIVYSAKSLQSEAKVIVEKTTLDRLNQSVRRLMPGLDNISLADSTLTSINEEFKPKNKSKLKFK